MDERAKGKLEKQLSEAQAKLVHHSRLEEKHKNTAERESKIGMECSIAGDDSSNCYFHNASEERKLADTNGSLAKGFSAEVEKIEAKLAQLNRP